MTGASGGAARPLVSIGVPAYNAERFIGEALDSLLGQTLTDLELIVSDNASTDGTREICEGYARRDPRVRYIRQAANIGAAANWNVVAREARGEFFKWASASDTCEPAMLEHCVAELRADPGAVLCYGKTDLMDENGRSFEVYADDRAFVEERPSERFLRVLELLKLNNAQCGVCRLDVLRRTRLDRPYPTGDMALMAELALYGTFRMLPEVLLHRRLSAETFTSMRTPLERERFNNPTATAPKTLVRTRRHLDHLRSIVRTPLPLGEKLRALRIGLRLARWDRVHMWRELRALLGRPSPT